MSKTFNNILDIENLLRSIEIFKNIENEEFKQIAKHITWKHYRKGAEVFPCKQHSNEVYFIASGRVRVTLFSSSGKEISYQELGIGEIFGELSAVDQLPRTANVIVTEAAQLGIMSRNDFWELVSQYPSISGAVLKRLAGMVRFLVERVYQYGALDVKDRVRAEILRLAKANISGDEFVIIQNFPTHSEIANRVNTHREAVTKELNELSRLGLIKQTQRVLTVTDIDRLSKLISEEI